MVSDVQAHLYSDGGDWGLPSIDADALAVHAMFRFFGVEYAATPQASRALSGEGLLPVVLFGDPASTESVMCAGLHRIVEELTNNDALPDPNSHLTPFMSAECSAFFELVRARLDPARLHELFCDDANYNDVRRALVAPGAWPLSALPPLMLRRAVRARLAGATPEAMMGDARRVVSALATRLGERSKYFYGDKPSTLDALVFGQLAVALMAPLPRPRLRAVVAEHQNLVAFVDRIYKDYFGGSSTSGSRLDVVEAAEEAREEARRRLREQSRRDASKEGITGAERGTQEERERADGNQRFMWLAAGAFAAHLLLSHEVDLE